MEKIILSSDVSKKLKKRFKEQKLTYYDIANRIQFSYSLISKMINGKRPINLALYNFILENFPNILDPGYVMYKYKRLSRIENILENTKISWYWIGFLLADGHFSRNGIHLSLSKKDRAHLQKFIEFIEYKGKVQTKTQITPFGRSHSNKISFGGKDEICKLTNILNLRHTCKTYNPPEDLPDLSQEKLICMFVGFVDGDGSISKRKRGNVTIEIEAHNSWKNYINQLINIIYECCGETYSNKIADFGTTVKFCISNPIVMKFLRKKIKEYCLPVLERKWNSLNKIDGSRFEEQRRREKLFPVLIKQGYSLKDLADFFNMSKPSVCRTIKRLGLTSPSKR